jgi:hypothetical protein
VRKALVWFAASIVVLLAFIFGRIYDGTHTFHVEINPTTLAYWTVNGAISRVKSSDGTIDIILPCVKIRYDRNDISDELDHIIGILPSALKFDTSIPNTLAFTCESTYNSLSFRDRKLITVGVVPR